jgi:hypothetical protein
LQNCSCTKNKGRKRILNFLKGIRVNVENVPNVKLYSLVCLYCSVYITT